MEQKTLERLHETEMEIMDFIKDVCDGNGLDYCLLYGSALGAFRHKGFIPWDDDIDAGMPRADYEKFKKIVLGMNCGFEFQDSENEEEFNLVFGKVRKKNTVFLESTADARLEKNGIFVDIFPLNNVRSKTVGFRIKNKIINYFKHILRFQSMRKHYRQRDGAVKFFIDSIISLPARIFPKKAICRKMNKLIIGKCSFEDAAFIAEYDQVGSAQLIEKDIYFPTKTVKFENREYKVPNKIEKYLEIEYGKDYMVLPPEEKRYTHNPAELVF